jgi:hypothetical protein
MAKARVTKYKTVRRDVVRVVSEEVPETVELTLTADEAQFIADVLARVGGDYHESRRGHSQFIAAALSDAGVQWDTTAEDVTGDIWCDNA